MQLISDIDNLKADLIELINSSEDIHIIDELFFNWITESISSSKNFFSDNFSRLVYYIEINPKISYLSKSVHSFWQNRKVAKSKSRDRDINRYKSFASAIIGKNPEYSSIDSNIVESNSYSGTALIIKKDKELKRIQLKCENLGDAILVLQNEYFIYFDLLRSGNYINLKDFDLHFDSDYYLKNNYNSILVLEPKLLIDVTSIAECFLINGNNHKIFFLKLFDLTLPSENLLLGNMINSIFDSIITNQEVNIDAALFQKPLSTFYLADKGKYFFDNIKSKAKSHFENLKFVLEDLEGDEFLVEPSFISLEYGLQGRLDLLIKYKDGQKDIIELKSGKSPKKSVPLMDRQGRTFSAPIWPNHLAQATCYNLLLDSAYEDRRGVSQILYSKNEENPFRNSINDIKIKKEVLDIRNFIVALLQKIASGKADIKSELVDNNFGPRPVYTNNTIKEFNENLKLSNATLTAYIQSATAFIAREIFALSTGKFSENRSNHNFDNSISPESTIFNAKLDLGKSDFQKLHLFFNYNNDLISIRVGDYVKISNSISTSGKIEKGTVKFIDNSAIVVSLRNKLNKFDFANISFTIQKEESDSLLKKNLPFIDYLTKSVIQDYILGFKFPENKNIKYPFEVSNDNQLDILNKAISCFPYYLVQGPPGTGKTRVIICNLIKYYNNIKKTVFITAYTNRAVENISKVLIDLELDYLRIGTKESTTDKNNIGIILENETPQKLYNKVKNSKIVIGTLSSFISNYEILEIKQTDVCIADEAAQILEVQLSGFVSKFEKFILVGDEKQLPSITLQSEDYYLEKNEYLNQIQLNSWNESLFERLLRLNKKHSTSAYGLLTSQARMASNIMNLASTLFYNNKLKKLENIHHNYYSKPFDKNILFIDSNSENNFKFNNSEVIIIQKICKHLINILEIIPTDIGIIAPFRLQCSKIKNGLEQISTEIEVDTVERFQGSERKVIIFSFSANRISDLKKMISPKEIDGKIIDRKLNVAITRAKELLIITGNSHILENYLVYKDMIELIKKDYLFLQSQEFNEIIDAKTKNVN